MKKDSLRKYKKEAQRDSGHGSADQPVSRPQLKPETKSGVVIVLIFSVAILCAFALFGWAGQFGQGINQGMKYLFGWAKYTVPFVLVGVGLLFTKPQTHPVRTSNYLGVALFVASCTAFLHLVAVPIERATQDIAVGRGGGYIGLLLYFPFQKIMGPWATGVVLLATLLTSMLIIFDVSLRQLYGSGSYFGHLRERFREFTQRLRINMNTTAPAEEPPTVGEPAQPQFGVKPIAEVAKSAAPSTASNQPDGAAEGQMAIFPKEKKAIRKIDIPIDLLESSNVKPMSGDIAAHKEKIQKTLKNFGIEVEMGETKVGPTVTQYTLKPSEGVKLSQITTLGNDLALALAAHPIRIEAPIPGKSLVGIEVPNQSVAVVKLKEILTSGEFKKRSSNLSIALGKDVAGTVWAADLDPMPHLLIAGATGSGKSVCLNAILLSLLYQNSPDELKLILVDPKRVELSVYNGIPHLITPVVNDITKTINALRWVVAEMDRRFELLSKTGHRNIQAYNHDNGNTMPYLVLAIDELADLMSVAANEVEAAIIRLAQMARAVGIHLILATQRPSVDIITGLIKANITSRIAFSVASAIDSRTILDSSGAEKLLGRGDMLYISSQLSKPKRLQGAYVTDQEITRVAEFLKQRGKPEYVEAVTNKVVDHTLSGNFEDLGDDELLEQAQELVIKAGKASASFLQRRLRIGYARAARILDLLEERGVIGPGDGAKPREILVQRDGVMADGESYEENNEPVDDDEPIVRQTEETEETEEHTDSTAH